MSEKMYNQNDLNVAKEIGRLANALEDMNQHIKIQNGRITALEGKMSKIDIMWGKIGVIVVIFGFVASTAWSLLTDFFKTMWHK